MPTRKKSRKTAPATLSSSLGRLIVLPREIRDQIYGHMFFHKYLVPKPKPRIWLHDYHNNPITEQCAEEENAHTGVLAASQALRIEALRIFYSQCDFQVQLVRGVRYRAEVIQPIPTTQMIESLQHVAVDIDMDHYDWVHTSCPQRDLDRFYQHILSSLASSDSMRKDCRIRFQRCTWDQAAWELLPFFGDIQRLTGFKKIVFELDGSKIDGEDNWESLWTTLQAKLQPTLGESVAYAKDYFRCLEFHPTASDAGRDTPHPSCAKKKEPRPKNSRKDRRHKRDELLILSCSD